MNDSLDQPIPVDKDVVRCDGGGGALGHPAVYLHFGDEQEVVCPYCSRRFALTHAHPKAAHP